MDGERRDVLPPGEHFSDHSYGAEGVDPYYNQAPLQPQSSQETAQYYSGSQSNGGGRYSPHSSFSSPSEQASYVTASQPAAAAPAEPRRKPSQRQRSGNLSMLRVGSIMASPQTCLHYMLLAIAPQLRLRKNPEQGRKIITMPAGPSQNRRQVREPTGCGRKWAGKDNFHSQLLF